MLCKQERYLLCIPLRQLCDLARLQHMWGEDEAQLLASVLSLLNPPRVLGTVSGKGGCSVFS